jgi:tetratricopeptide (TPR) repeat protein
MIRRLALALLCVALAHGSVAARDLLLPNAQEEEALRSMRADKMIRAREQAEKILSSDPDSILGRYVLAEVFHGEEGNLPRALHHLRRAQSLFKRHYGQAPTESRPQQWHRRFLLAEERVLGEMDRRVEQLAVIDHYDRLYRPKLDHIRIWPLMKLHRFEEAIRIANAAILSEDEGTRISGYNGLLSIEFERKRPKSCFQVAMHALEQTGYRSCILNLNTAEAAFAVFRFDDVERLAQKSLQSPIKDCPSSAHSHLASLFLLRADFQRAISAVKSARTEGIARRLRQQFEMANAAWLMRLLYSLGKFDDAARLTRQIVRAPDRVGLTSFSKELMEAIYLISHHAALLAQMEAIREKASARGFLARAELWLRIQALELEAWRTRRQALQFLAEEQMIVDLVRPYIKPFPPWTSPTLIPVAGEGIVLRAIQLAEKQQSQPEKIAPYFGMLRGEIHYRNGEYELAQKLGEAALRSLAKDEVLLRARITAWLAQAALRLGQAEGAKRHFERVLDEWPTALRLLSIRLPVELTLTDGPLAKRAAEQLRRSPRLAFGGAGASLGFKVRLVETAQSIRICLHGPSGRQYGCSETKRSKLKEQTTDEERLALIVDNFHNEVFAPKVDLTQQDINSLDGSAVRGRADDVLKQVLGQ